MVRKAPRAKNDADLEAVFGVTGSRRGLVALLIGERDDGRGLLVGRASVCVEVGMRWVLDDHVLGAVVPSVLRVERRPLRTETDVAFSCDGIHLSLKHVCGGESAERAGERWRCADGDGRASD